MTDERIDAFVADLAARLAAQGFPRMPAAVLMALVSSDAGRLGSAELAERLQASPAAISGAVRYLGVVGFVRTLATPGSRRHVYALSDLPWYTGSLVDEARWAELAGVLERHAAALPAGPAADRIEETAAFFRFLETRMPQLLEEWEAIRAARASSPPARPASG